MSIFRTTYEFRRDTGLSQERFIGPDQGRDSDRRNISAHGRLGRVRSSPGKFSMFSYCIYLSETVSVSRSCSQGSP